MRGRVLIFELPRVSAFQSLPLVTKGRWREAPEGIRTLRGSELPQWYGKTYTPLISSVAFGDSVSLRLGHGVGLTAHRAVIQHHAAALLPW